MNSDSSLNIIFRAKIPFLTNTVGLVMGVLFAVLVMLYIVMSPSETASPEMRAGYYIIVVPQWLKIASACAALGLMVICPFYFTLKRNLPGLLEMGTTEIKITRHSKTRVIPLSTVQKILVNDMERLGGRLKYKTEVILNMMRAESCSFVLADYEDTDRLVELLSQYDDTVVEFVNQYSLQDHDAS